MQFVIYPLYISLAKFRRGTLFKEGVIFLGAPAFGTLDPPLSAFERGVLAEVRGISGGHHNFEEA